MLADFPIFGGYNKRQNVSFDSEDLVNLFLVQDYDGKKKHAFIGTPGLAERVVVNGSNAQSRELFAFGSSLYGVFGSAVYRFSPTQTSLVGSKFGDIGTTKGAVSITANNGNQVIFVDGQAGYIFSNAGVFTKISSSGFPLSQTNVVFLDGFFVVPLANSNAYQISAPNDGTKWDALDTATINAYPGNNVGVGVVNRRLFFFKETSTEVWYNQGATDFPFRRDNNLLFNYGCLTAASISSDFGYLFWLSQDKSGVGSVMMTQGDSPKRVSNDSVDNLIANFTAPRDISTYIYKDLGHIFFVMNWNTDDTTLVYDVTTDKWHKMEMLPSVQSDLTPYSGKTRHLSNCHAFFNNRHYVGSYKNPTIYEFDRAFTQNAGEVIRRSRTCPHFFDPSYKMIQINSLQVDMEMGIGVNNGEFDVTLYPQFDSLDPGVNPKVTLSLSRDGGYKFGNELEASIGRIGNRLARAKWRKKGQARDFVARFSFYAPTGPVVILGASIDYEVLTK